MNVVDIRRAFLLALHAGKAGPDGVVFDQIRIRAGQRLGQKPAGGVTLVDSGERADGSAFATV